MSANEFYFSVDCIELTFSKEVVLRRIKVKSSGMAGHHCCCWLLIIISTKNSISTIRHCIRRDSQKERESGIGAVEYSVRHGQVTNTVIAARAECNLLSLSNCESTIWDRGKNSAWVSGQWASEWMSVCWCITQPNLKPSICEHWQQQQQPRWVPTNWHTKNFCKVKLMKNLKMPVTEKPELGPFRALWGGLDWIDHRPCTTATITATLALATVRHHCRAPPPPSHSFE